MAREKSRFLGALTFVLVLICAACGGSSGTRSGGPPPPTISSVLVRPASTNIQPGVQQQFTATVSGTGDFAKTVTWVVSGSSDDGNLGAISSSGLYTAATNPPNPNTVTIKATSTLDFSKSASASVVIGSSPFQITGVTISPTSATLKTIEALQFMATVRGTGNFGNAVSWSMLDGTSGNSTEGTISASGLYTAPGVVPVGGSVTVEIRSAVDTSIAATAQVTLSQGPPTITQLSSSTANASDSMRVIGTGFADTFAGGSGGLAQPFGSQINFRDALPLSRFVRQSLP